MMNHEVVEGTAIFNATEELLRAWSRERAQMRRSIQRSLNTPKASSISEMIEQQRIFEGKLHGVRRKRHRTESERVVREFDGRKVRQCACGTIFAGHYCPSCSPDPKVVRIAQGDLDARGRSTPSTKIAPLKYGLTSRAAIVNASINRLSRKMGEAIDLAYGDDLPDRVCARVLGIPRPDFTLRRRAAVALIADLLAGRMIPAVHSARPT